MLTANGKVVAAIAVVALVAGALLDYREFIVLGVGLALALAAAAVVLQRRPALHVRRDVNPARVVEGEAAFATVTVTNQGTRRTREARGADGVEAPRRVHVAVEGGDVGRRITRGRLSCCLDTTISVMVPPSLALG